MVMPLKRFQAGARCHTGSSPIRHTIRPWFEILALVFMQKPKIKGIRVGAHEINITQYADFTTVFLKKN